MPLTLDWPEIVLRLALSVAAGAIIGFNRDEHGRPAGLRTTLLVCLAASLTMIEVNLLPGTAGRPRDSFVNFDVMRLPLGILTGMGFIGAGAILKRQDRVMGVTTAATLWFVTVIGILLGSGQLRLGIAGTALGIVVLGTLQRLERYIPRDRQAKLVLVASPPLPAETVEGFIEKAGFRVLSRAVSYAGRQKSRLELTVQWRSRAAENRAPAFLTEIAELAGVQRLDWRPEGRDD